jgi:hypothetical protein
MTALYYGRRGAVNYDRPRSRRTARLAGPRFDVREAPSYELSTMNKVLGFVIAGVLLATLFGGLLYWVVQWGHDRQKLAAGLYYWDHAHCYKVSTQRGSIVRFRNEVDRANCPPLPEDGPQPPGMEWSALVHCDEYNCKRDQSKDPIPFSGLSGGGYGATREEACRDAENENRKFSARWKGGCQVRNCRCTRTIYRSGKAPPEFWDPVPDGGGGWRRIPSPRRLLVVRRPARKMVAVRGSVLPRTRFRGFMSRQPAVQRERRIQGSKAVFHELSGTEGG